MTTDRYQRALVMLRERIGSVRRRQAVKDGAYALRMMRESNVVPEGRLATLADLQKQAEEADATHNPENVKKLVNSLQAFLNEEIQEETEPEPELEPETAPESDKPVVQPQPEQPPEESLMEEQAQPTPEGDGKTVVCEACGHKMALSEQMASTGSVPGPIGEAGAAPDGEEEPMEQLPEEEEPTAPVKESAAPAAKATKREVDAPAVLAREAQPPNAMNDTERAELVALRAEKLQRVMLGKAKVAIREAGVFLNPTDLIKFSESQWPTLLKMAPATAPRAGIGDESAAAMFQESEAASHPAPVSAREAFERRLRLVG